MSNINGNKKQKIDPFRSPNSHLPQSVGSNYGDRLKYQKLQTVSPTTANPQTHKNIDQFREKTPPDLTHFDPNAAYKAQRRQAAGAPYKPALLDGVENGTIQRVSRKAGVPSDDAILNFLDRVIDITSNPSSNTANAVPKKASFVKLAEHSTS